MSRAIDQKTYRTFEEFEREELRRDSYFDSGYEVLEEMFAGDLDFDRSSGRKSASTDDDEE
ncbi:MAG TPA: hypothetical protein VHJ20_09180 [Polyangia bacterium]|nr:hypothetical protein [Polyangia bacterium]